MIDMSFVRVRACILRCKEYVIISPNDPNNQKLIKLFEGKHRGHAIVSVALSEVKDYCKNVGKQLKEEI